MSLHVMRTGSLRYNKCEAVLVWPCSEQQILHSSLSYLSLELVNSLCYDLTFYLLVLVHCLGTTACEL